MKMASTTLIQDMYVFTSCFGYPIVEGHLTQYTVCIHIVYSISKVGAFLLYIICKHLKGAVSLDFCHFFISWIEAIWALISRLKWFLLKNSFSWRYLWNQWLQAVLACAESDSAEIEMSANPKLTNTARSWTLCRLTAQANTAWSQTIFFLFSKNSFFGEFRIHMMIFRTVLNIFSKIKNWLTLRGVDNLIFRRSKSD